MMEKLIHGKVISGKERGLTGPEYDYYWYFCKECYCLVGPFLSFAAAALAAYEDLGVMQDD